MSSKVQVCFQRSVGSTTNLAVLYIDPRPQAYDLRILQEDNRVRPTLHEALSLTVRLAPPPSSPMPWSIRGPRACVYKVSR